MDTEEINTENRRYEEVSRIYTMNRRQLEAKAQVILNDLIKRKEQLTVEQEKFLNSKKELAPDKNISETNDSSKTNNQIETLKYRPVRGDLLFGEYEKLAKKEANLNNQIKLHRQDLTQVEQQLTAVGKKIERLENKIVENKKVLAEVESVKKQSEILELGVVRDTKNARVEVPAKQPVLLPVKNIELSLALSGHSSENKTISPQVSTPEFKEKDLSLTECNESHTEGLEDSLEASFESAFALESKAEFRDLNSTNSTSANQENPSKNKNLDERQPVSSFFEYQFLDKQTKPHDDGKTPDSNFKDVSAWESSNQQGLKFKYESENGNSYEMHLEKSATGLKVEIQVQNAEEWFGLNREAGRLRRLLENAGYCVNNLQIKRTHE